MTPIDILFTSGVLAHIIFSWIAVFRLFITGSQWERANENRNGYAITYGKVVFSMRGLDESFVTAGLFLGFIYVLAYVLLGVLLGGIIYEANYGFYAYAMLGYSMAGTLVALDIINWTGNGGRSWLFLCDFIDQEVQDEMEITKYNNDHPRAPMPTKQEQKLAQRAVQAATLQIPKETSATRRLIRK